MNFKSFIILGSCLIYTIGTTAQKVSYKTGSTFLTTYNAYMEKLGMHDGYAFYLTHHQENQIENNKILKIDISSLEITETLDLYHAGFKGSLNLHKIIDQNLFLIFKNPTYNGEKVVSCTVEAIKIDMKQPLEAYTSKDLVDFDDNWPNISYLSDKSMFKIYQGEVKKYFDHNLAEVVIKETPSDGSNLNGLNTKGFGMDDIGMVPYEKSKGSKTQEYFYPLFNGTNLYVESSFKSDTRCAGRKEGYYQRIELCEYYSKTESKTRRLIINIKPGAMILNYECYFYPDSSLLVFGVYQEGDLKSNKVSFGTFSLVTNTKLEGSEKANFQQLFECHPDKRFYHKDYSLLFKLSNAIRYEPARVFQKDHYYLTFSSHPELAFWEFSFIKINKKTGSTAFHRLYNSSETSLVWEGFTGFYILPLSDSINLVFYNDHKKNAGLPSGEAKLTGNGYKPKECVFSYSVYKADSGFSTRIGAIPALTDKFLLDVEVPDIMFLGKNKEGHLEFILVAYDVEKKNGKFYKVIVEG